jgi:putative oxidoreductase
MDIVLLISRLFISSLFLWAGMAKVLQWNGTIAYMASKNFPLIHVLLPAAVAIQLLGGLSLLLGFQIRIGAALLIIFIVPATIMMHDFWNLDGMERVIEMTMFMKDMAIFGGLLLLFVTGAGRYSFDR